MLELSSLPSQIRPMVHADLERVLSWRNHPDVRRYMYTQHEITLDEHQRWFEHTLTDTSKHLLVFELDHQPVGFVNLSKVDGSEVADWGFYLAPAAPKGIGRQFGRAALNHAFLKLKLHKINGEALATNERSIKFHQSLGFAEQIAQRHKHFDGDNYHDVIRFSLLDREWQTKP